MSLVYLVSSGCYSDYRVLGVFSTLERAQAAKDHLETPNDLEPMKLDAIPDCPPPGYWAFHVRLLKDGSAESVYRRERWISPSKADHVFIHYPSAASASFHVIATSAEHAVKIANEKRLAILAADRWKSGRVEE